MEFVEKNLMVDAVEALGNISIEDIFRFLTDVDMYSFNRVVAASAGAKPIRIGFKECLPLWL